MAQTPPQEAARSFESPGGKRAAMMKSTAHEPINAARAIATAVSTRTGVDFHPNTPTTTSGTANSPVDDLESTSRAQHP